MEQINNIKKKFDGYFPCVKWEFCWIKDENGKEQHIKLRDNNGERRFYSNAGYFVTYNRALKELKKQMDDYIDGVLKTDHPKREEFIKLIQENSYIKGFNFKDMEVIK